MRNLRSVITAFVLCVCCASVFGAPVYIDNVPDWDAPVCAGVTPLGSGWDAWCVPTAAANIMGYYRDRHGIASIADASVFANTAAWTANDFQDDTADQSNPASPAFGTPRNDVGYYMNTNDLGQIALDGISSYSGTMLSDIKPGLDGSGVGGHTGYFPAAGLNNVTVINAANVATAAKAYDTSSDGPHTVLSVWQRLTDNIDAGRPILGTFHHWGLVNKVSVRGTGPTNLLDYDWYQWGANPQNGPGGESWTNPDIGHTITIVGYWDANDATSPYYDSDNGWAPRAIILHDGSDGYLNNPNRPLPVVVPFDVAPGWANVNLIWAMNTEIVVPEPATVTLLLLGTGTIAVLRRRRKR